MHSSSTLTEQQYSSFSDRTLHSMDTWLRNDPEPSWARIVAALNAIEENALTARIERKHGHTMKHLQPVLRASLLLLTMTFHFQVPDQLILSHLIKFHLLLHPPPASPHLLIHFQVHTLCSRPLPLPLCIPLCLHLLS